MFKKMLIGNTKEGRLFKAGAMPILLMFAMGMMAFMATVCMADGGAGSASTPDAVKELLDKVIFPIFTGMILSLLSILIHYVSRKYKLEGLIANQELIEKAALQGIALAEEKAAQAIQGKLTGDMKLRLAIEHIQGVIPTITYGQARNVIEGMLARIPGVGATKEKSITPPAPLLP